MADLRIKFNEAMVGSGHPSLPDTLNRLALVEHNNDGKHRYNNYEIDVREFLPEGFVTDGSVDYSAEFNDAIESIRDYSFGSGGVLRIPLGHWNLGSGAAGLTLYEGVSILGVSRPEYVSGAPAGGTWLFYSGTGDAIKIDGEWIGFDSRREITLGKFGIKSSSGANSAISADFLTQFKFSDINIKGVSAYGIHALNTYNGLMSRVKIDGPDNPLYMSIKDSPDDVFSGQMLFQKCDFWNGTGRGVHLKSSVNVLAQFVFLACHMKGNAYGAYLEGTNLHKVNFLGCHFEGNTTNDLYTHSDMNRGPVVRGCHFNNTLAVYKVNLQGEQADIEDNEFTGGGTGYGVLVNGADNRVAHNHFQGMASNKQIVIDTSASRTGIGKNTFSNTAGRIIDNSTARTTSFEGEVILDSRVFVLSDPAGTEVKFRTNKEYWIRKVEIVYPAATSEHDGVSLQFGTSDDLTAFVNHTSDVDQNGYDAVTPALSASYIEKGKTITFRCAGGKTGGGSAKFTAVLVPFANI